MNIEDLRNYILSKPHVSESLPFDEHTLVFKVIDKVFAITSMNRLPHAVNLKCDPEKSIALRESYTAVQPGYHMNKKHWNTVEIMGDAPEDLLKELINHSYDLVVKGMTKKVKEKYGL